MKTFIGLVLTVIFFNATAENIDNLLEEGFEIKSTATVAAGGMYFVLQKDALAFVCPALDPSRVHTCIKVQGEVSE